jgi:hypothetical protein
MGCRKNIMFFAARCRIVAPAFPVFVGFLSGSLGMGAGIGLCAGSSYGIAVLPETSHREPDTQALTTLFNSRLRTHPFAALDRGCSPRRSPMRS